VMEGQATWLMADYTLRQSGMSLETNPGLLENLAAAMEKQDGSYPVLAKAPPYIQQTLLFPYTWGVRFQDAVYRKMGKRAFAEVFRHPPVSTAQILHPEKYFEHEKPARPPLPKLDSKDHYKKLMDGTLGEMDYKVMLEEFVSPEESKELAPLLCGSLYRLEERRHPGPWNQPGNDVLLLSSEWASEQAAGRFLQDYRKLLQAKRKSTKFVYENSTWLTGRAADGAFVVHREGARVWVMEGLSDARDAKAWRERPRGVN
jgi:hypothetical protein